MWHFCYQTYAISHLEMAYKTIISLHDLEKKNNKFLLSFNNDKIQTYFWTKEEPLVVELQ